MMLIPFSLTEIY